jgi:cell division protein FtsL
VNVDSEKLKAKSKGGSVLSFVLLVFWLLSVASSIGVIYSTYESRKATQELESLRIEASGMKVMSGQFFLEKSTLSAFSRVERIATKKLNMITPDPDKTVLVYRK